MRTVESIKPFAFSTPFAVVAAIAGLAMACTQEERPVDQTLDDATETSSKSAPDSQDREVASLLTPVDTPTGTPCTYTTECPFNAYCNPNDQMCYYAIGFQCASHAECSVYGAGTYCHRQRCHKGGIPCQNNLVCPSGTYCHVGICHGDMCMTNMDCPAGVTCYPPMQACLIP